MATKRREATLQLLSQQTLGHADDLLDGLVDLLVQAEQPGFYDEESTADLRVAVGEGLVVLLEVLAGTRSLDEALEVPRATGRRQVQQALPLEGALRSYRLTGAWLWDHLVAQARASGSPVGDALLDGASEVWRVVDLFCTVTAEAFRAEEGQLRERDERIRAGVLGALLEGRGADPQFARDATHALGVPLGGPFACVVGVAHRPDEPALDNPRQRLRSAGTASAWTTVAGSDVGLVALGARRLDAVRELLLPAVRGRVGMSPAFAELADLPRARHLADLAARTPGDGPAVRLLQDDPVSGLVVDAPVAAAVLHECSIGRLLAADAPDGPALLATLRAFLAAEGSLSDAAKASFVHRNTMLYRLNKIEKLTGLSVRSLHDQVVWVLALKEHDRRERESAGPAAQPGPQAGAASASATSRAQR